MFDLTKAAVKKMIDDVKRFINVCGIVTQIFPILFLGYKLLARSGNVWINAALLTLSFAYFLFYCIVKGKEYNKNTKQLSKIGKRLFKCAQLLCKLLNLGIILYGLYPSLNETATKTDVLTMMLVLVMLLAWVLDVVLLLVSFVIDRYSRLLEEGFQADVEQLKAPVTTVGNFFKKIKGEEIPPPNEPPKTVLYLEQLAEKDKAEKAAQKAAKKAEKQKTKQAPPPAKTEKIKTSEELAVAAQKKKSLFKREKK